jgi:hypothetical protein
MQGWREKLVNNKQANMKEEIALRALLTGNKVTELGHLFSLAYKIKCEWENELRLGESKNETVRGMIGYNMGNKTQIKS